MVYLRLPRRKCSGVEIMPRTVGPHGIGDGSIRFFFPGGASVLIQGQYQINYASEILDSRHQPIS